jgi:hypothetical protein
MKPKGEKREEGRKGGEKVLKTGKKDEKDKKAFFR